MSSGYTKIFASILDSTVWSLSKEARLLWITMLVKKDRQQVVRASVPGLAHAARITLAECETALEELSQPDPHSQSKEEEGRRIVTLPDGGWLVVNGAKYRDLMSVEERRAYQAAWQRNYREKKRVRESAAAAGEKRYEKAEGDGEPEAVKDKIVTDSLPEGLQ